MSTIPALSTSIGYDSNKRICIYREMNKPTALELALSTDRLSLMPTFIPKELIFDMAQYLSIMELAYLSRSEYWAKYINTPYVWTKIPVYLVDNSIKLSLCAAGNALQFLPHIRLQLGITTIEGTLRFLDESNAQNLSAVYSMKHLQSLSIRFDTLDQSLVQAYPNWIHLQSLDIRNESLESFPSSHLQRINRLPKLQSLTLDNFKIDLDGVSAMNSFPCLNQLSLVECEFKNSHVSEDAVEQQGVAESCLSVWSGQGGIYKSLKSLDMNGCIVSGTDLIHICQSAEAIQNLEQLSINDVCYHIGPWQLAIVANLVNLRALDIKGHPLSYDLLNVVAKGCNRLGLLFIDQDRFDLNSDWAMNIASSEDLAMWNEHSRVSFRLLSPILQLTHLKVLELTGQSDIDQKFITNVVDSLGELKLLIIDHIVLEMSRSDLLSFMSKMVALSIECWVKVNWHMCILDIDQTTAAAAGTIDIRLDEMASRITYNYSHQMDLESMRINSIINQLQSRFNCII